MPFNGFPISTAALVGGIVGIALWLVLAATLRHAPRGGSGPSPDGDTVPVRAAILPYRISTLLVCLLVAASLSALILLRQPQSLAHAISLGVLAMLIPASATATAWLRRGSIRTGMLRISILFAAAVLATGATHLVTR